jgi:hypothetical protein
MRYTLQPGEQLSNLRETVPHGARQVRFAGSEPSFAGQVFVNDFKIANRVMASRETPVSSFLPMPVRPNDSIGFDLRNGAPVPVTVSVMFG